MRLLSAALAIAAIVLFSYLLLQANSPVRDTPPPHPPSPMAPLRH